MSSRVFAPGHIKDPVTLIEKSRAPCPGGRVPPSFNRISYMICSRPEDGLRCRQGVKLPLKLKTLYSRSTGR